MSSHKARKRFGQNFLHDPHVIHNIISSVAASSDEHIVEIGPGLGALTEHLVQLCGKLSAIELDRELVPLLKSRFNKHPSFSIFQADALNFDFCSLITHDTPNKIRVVGNLPYNISTPLIFHLITYINQIQDMYFMLQKELVDRICAKENENNYGRLSVMVQYYCEAEKLFDVEPDAFRPAPKVDSAILRLNPHKHSPYGGTDTGLLNKVVTAAFSQRRKTIKNTLKGLADENLLLLCDIDPTARAENISLASFVAITEKIKKINS